MDVGERITGTRDEHYNLISILYHALHGVENCEIYAVDAEAAGDERLAAFFRVAQAAQAETAERAKELLGISPDIASPSTVPEDAGDVPADSAILQSEVAPGGTATGYELPPDAPTEEVSLTTNLPRTPPRGTQGDVLESGAPPGSSPSTEDMPSQLVDDLPDEDRVTLPHVYESHDQRARGGGLTVCSVGKSPQPMRSKRTKRARRAPRVRRLLLTLFLPRGLTCLSTRRPRRGRVRRAACRCGFRGGLRRSRP